MAYEAANLIGLLYGPTIIICEVSQSVERSSS